MVLGGPRQQTEQDLEPRVGDFRSPGDCADDAYIRAYSASQLLCVEGSAHHLADEGLVIKVAYLKSRHWM